MTLQTLVGHTGGPIASMLSRAVERLPVTSAFNPSILQGRGAWTVAVRGLEAGARPPFGAWVGQLRDGAWVGPLLDLSQHAAEHGIERVSDPKLFTLDGEPWVTFNTGTPATGPNEIHVLRVGNSLGVPIRCVLPGRERIEKNWAFIDDRGAVRVVYGLDPLIVLDRVHVTSSAWTFGSRSAAAPPLDVRRSLSLGTPLVRVGDRWLGVAHERHHLGRRRIYVGRPVTVDVRDAMVRVGSRRVVHSIPSLLGSRVRHNPNLLSCTYFSGLHVADQKAVLAYGVNDVASGFAELAESELW